MVQVHIIKEKARRLIILLHRLPKKISPSSPSRSLSSTRLNLVKLLTSLRSKIRFHFWKISLKSSSKPLHSQNSKNRPKSNHKNHRNLFMSKTQLSIQLCPAKNRSRSHWLKNYNCWRQTLSMSTKRINKKTATISEYKMKSKDNLTWPWRQRF